MSVFGKGDWVILALDVQFELGLRHERQFPEAEQVETDPQRPNIASLG